VISRFIAHPAIETGFELGEGPVWDSARDRLLWVDAVAGQARQHVIGPR
jgi:sugar lactone lactonase YvrE